MYNYFIWDKLLPFCCYGMIIGLSCFVVFAYLWDQAMDLLFDKRKDDD